MGQKYQFMHLSYCTHKNLINGAFEASDRAMMQVIKDASAGILPQYKIDILNSLPHWQNWDDKKAIEAYEKWISYEKT
jgi:hypothetical protein